jgi:hypothetical protein
MLAVAVVLSPGDGAKSRAVTAFPQLVLMVGEIILGYVRQNAGRIRSVPYRLRERGLQALDQDLSVEGFAQEADCSRFQGPVAVACDGKSGDKDEGKALALGEQMGLQVEPVHNGHPDIGYHAGRIAEVGRSQEIFGRGEGMDRIAKRLDQICGGGANRAVIVDDRYHLRVGQGDAFWKTTRGCPLSPRSGRLRRKWRPENHT